MAFIVLMAMAAVFYLIQKIRINDPR